MAEVTPNPAEGAAQQVIVQKDNMLESLIELLKKAIKKLLEVLNAKYNKYKAVDIQKWQKKLDEDIDALKGQKDLNLNALQNLVSFANQTHDYISNSTEENVLKAMEDLHEVMQDPKKLVKTASEKFTFIGNLPDVIRTKFQQETTKMSNEDIDKLSIYTDGKDHYIGVPKNGEMKVAKLSIGVDGGKETIKLGDPISEKEIKGLREVSKEGLEGLSLESRALICINGLSNKHTELIEAKKCFEIYKQFKETYSSPIADKKSQTIAKYCESDDSFRVFDTKSNMMIAFKLDKSKSEGKIDVYVTKLPDNTIPFPIDGTEPPINYDDHTSVRRIASYGNVGDRFTKQTNSDMPRAAAKLLDSAASGEYLRCFNIDNAAMKKSEHELKKAFLTESNNKKDIFKDKKSGVSECTRLLDNAFQNSSVNYTICGTSTGVRFEFEDGLTANIKFSKYGIPQFIDYSKKGTHEKITAYANGCHEEVHNVSSSTLSRFYEINQLVTETFKENIFNKEVEVENDLLKTFEQEPLTKEPELETETPTAPAEEPVEVTEKFEEAGYEDL